MRDNVLILETVDSTNDYLKREAEKGAPDGTVVIAREQTSGKGRKSHSFVSTQGGIYYSLLIRPEGYTPADILSVTPKIRQMDKHLLEAAADLGCTPLETFFRVELPAILPGVLSGLLMSFTLSIDDFIITQFTKGEGFLSNFLQAQMDARRDPKKIAARNMKKKKKLKENQ